MKNENKTLYIIIFIMSLLIVGLLILCINFYLNSRVNIESQLPTEPVVYDIAVTKNKVSIRDLPYETENPVNTLKKDSKVEIIETSNKWTRIRFLKETGYVLTNELQLFSANKKQTMVNLPMRIKPNDGKVIYRITKGSIIEEKEVIGGWSKITYNNTIGYVANEYLRDYTTNTDIITIK